MINDVAIVFLSDPSKLKTLKADVFSDTIAEDIIQCKSYSLIIPTMLTNRKEMDLSVDQD